jgi:hypothetical protein
VTVWLLDDESATVKMKGAVPLLPSFCRTLSMERVGAGPTTCPPASVPLLPS